MSYILDALNKSEQERSRKRLKSMEQSASASQRHGWQWHHTLITLFTLITLNIAAFYWFYVKPAGKTDSALNTAASSTSEPAPERTAIVNPVPTTPRQPATQLALTPAPQPIVQRQLVVHDMDDLPPDILKVLPEIEVTSHIYASDPAYRTAKIDQVSRKEGEFIGPEHRLITITELGLILDFRGNRYRFNVVEDWQLGD